MRRTSFLVSLLTLALCLSATANCWAQSPPNVTTRDAVQAGRWLKGKVARVFHKQRDRLRQRSQSRQQDRQARKAFKQFVKANPGVKRAFHDKQFALHTTKAGIYKYFSAAAGTPAVAHGLVTGNPVTLGLGAVMLGFSAADHISQKRGNHKSRVHALRYAVHKGRTVPANLLSHYGTDMKAQAGADLQWARETVGWAQVKYGKALNRSQKLDQRRDVAKGWLSKKVLSLRADRAHKAVKRTGARRQAEIKRVDRLTQEVARLQQVVR